MAIASHPEVAAHIGVDAQAVGAISQRANVIPLAGEHGGFLFTALDSLGLLYELHTLFSPEGWGREVVTTAHEAAAYIFTAGAQLLVTYEQKDWWRSAPPKSHGWVSVGDFNETRAGDVRLWTLSRIAWDASPAVRRWICQ